MKMTAERWMRMYQILYAVELLVNENRNTSVRGIYEYLKIDDLYININLINSSIRHYRKIGLIKRNHKPYKRPFQYILTKKGEEQFDWLEFGEYLDYNY